VYYKSGPKSEEIGSPRHGSYVPLFIASTANSILFSFNIRWTIRMKRHLQYSQWIMERNHDWNWAKINRRKQPCTSSRRQLDIWRNWKRIEENITYPGSNTRNIIKLHKRMNFTRNDYYLRLLEILQLSWTMKISNI